MKSSKDNLQRHYSILGLFELGVSVILSKLIDRRIRYFNFPIILKGRKFIDFGENLTAGYYCRFEVYPRITKKGNVSFLETILT